MPWNPFNGVKHVDLPVSTKPLRCYDCHQEIPVGTRYRKRNHPNQNKRAAALRSVNYHVECP